MQNSGLGNVIKCHLFFQITLITCNINTELEIKNSNARYSLSLEFGLVSRIISCAQNSVLQSG